MSNAKRSPMSRRAPFTQADVTRAGRGAAKAGLNVTRIEVDRDSGKIIIIAGPEQTPPDQTPPDQNEWDGQ
jgi:hypothetical protein